MFNCKDPRLTYLNSLGYNVVRLPRQGIDPLHVLGREGKSLEDLGHLKTVWTTTEPLPPVSGPNEVPNVNGEKSQGIKLSVGLKILEGVLKGMGLPISVPNLETGFASAQKLQFAFANVASYAVKPFEIGNWLQEGDLNLKNAIASRYLSERDNAEAFIIVDVLKSDHIQVTALDSKDKSIEVDLAALQGLVSSKVKLNKTSASTVTFQHSGGPLTFGFKVFRIGFENGQWAIRGTEPSPDRAFSIEAPEAGESVNQDGETPVLFGESGSLLNLQIEPSKETHA